MSNSSGFPGSINSYINTANDLKMETVDKKTRAPNFSTQECHLLADVMGEKADGFEISRHKLDKHRFTDRITSSTKKVMWKDIEQKFNASSVNVYRTSHDLQKKWENLVSKQRSISSDYIRDMNTTGSGPTPTKYSLLTEAIMSVIGKESLSVSGAGGGSLDSAIVQLKNSAEKRAAEPEDTSETSKWTAEEETHVTVKETGKRKCIGCCLCDQELINLKKKKLKLQIAMYEKQLGLNAEQ